MLCVGNTFEWRWERATGPQGRGLCGCYTWADVSVKAEFKAADPDKVTEERQGKRVREEGLDGPGSQLRKLV